LARESPNKGQISSKSRKQGKKRSNYLSLDGKKEVKKRVWQAFWSVKNKGILPLKAGV
jgi:hypothetical protein